MPEGGRDYASSFCFAVCSILSAPSMAPSIIGRYSSGQSFSLWLTRCRCSLSSRMISGLKYQRLYNVGVKQTEAPGLYKYYSTQRPVDIGTFPKPPRNAPDEIVNYDQRVPVENGSFLAWGHLTYTRPLTKRQASDYELRPAPDNPDRPRSIREQMKTAAKQAEADRGQAAPKKNAPDRDDR